jgi:recombination protein RecR
LGVQVPVGDAGLIFARMNLPSRLMESAVDQISSLPGIGRKTALRLALHLLRRDADRVAQFAHSLTAMREGIQPCVGCGNLTEHSECSICQDPMRDERTICVVEDLRDLLAFESIGQYRGKYHVLGGIISPMDGIGPADLNIDALLGRAAAFPTTETSEVLAAEIIFALPTTMEGETTAFYLYKKLASHNVRVTAIARGVAVGDELQHVDEATLAQSLRKRLPYSDKP